MWQHAAVLCSKQCVGTVWLSTGQPWSAEVLTAVAQQNGVSQAPGELALGTTSPQPQAGDQQSTGGPPTTLKLARKSHLHQKSRFSPLPERATQCTVYYDPNSDLARQPTKRPLKLLPFPQQELSPCESARDKTKEMGTTVGTSLRTVFHSPHAIQASCKGLLFLLRQGFPRPV